MPASLSEFSRRAETPSRSPIHRLLLATGTRTDTGRGAPQPHRQTPWPQPPDLHSEVCSNSSRHCAYVPPTSPVNGDRCPHARRYSLTASSLLSRCPFQAVGVTTVCYATVSLRTGGQHAQYGEVADGSRTETSLTGAAHESARPCPRSRLCTGQQRERLHASTRVAEGLPATCADGLSLSRMKRPGCWCRCGHSDPTRIRAPVTQCSPTPRCFRPGRRTYCTTA